jgi:hypothetical protein
MLAFDRLGHLVHLLKLLTGDKLLHDAMRAVMKRVAVSVILAALTLTGIDPGVLTRIDPPHTV